ncbi:MAG: hypothetical protein RLZZ450_2491 [Pseudomonadota bacterium]|jgi:hypothetical protein
MQHSESRPSFTVLPRDDYAPRSHDALWTSLGITIVGVALALTYALAQFIATSWVFVD